MSKANKTRIVYSSITAAAFLCWILFGQTSISQGWHAHQAEKHILLLKQILQEHPEFQDVNFSISTSNDGCLVVRGWVETEKDREELKRIIDATKPQFFVKYMVGCGRPKIEK